MDELDFQACSLVTTEKESCYMFKAGPLITDFFFPWSLVKSQRSDFKALKLVFQSLSGKNQQSSVFTAVYKVTNILVSVFKA